MLRTFSKNIAVVLMSFHHWKSRSGLACCVDTPELAHAARGHTANRVAGWACSSVG
jgi:hypothetical protein